MICPKCNYTRSDKDDPSIPNYECPACGIIYTKYKIPVDQGKPAVFEIDESTPQNTFRKPNLELAKPQPQEKLKINTGSLKNELKLKYDKIAKEIGDDRFFTKKELDHLPEILMPNEEVLAFSSGMMEGNTWLIALTDKRILFVDKGLIFGVKQVSIDLDKVNAVSGRTGIFFGDISIQDGAKSRVITNVLKKTVIPFTNKVRDAIESRKTERKNQTNIDLIEKLEKLAALFERGILSKSEFEQQKSALFNKEK